MKKRWSIVAACLLIIVCAIGLAACNPNDDGGGTTPEETISGTYYLYDNGYIKNDYFRFNEDGTFNRVNGTYNLSGTYTVSDSTITIIAEESGEQISASFTVSNGIFKVTNNGISYYYCKEGKTPSGDTPTPPSDGETVEYDGMTFEKLSDGTYSLKHGKVGSVEIPNSINGVPVSQISEMAFMSSEATINVYIPETVKNVGKNAFYRSSVKTIYCQSPNKPQGWSDVWNLRNGPNDCIPVYWNINENTCSKQGDGIYILENGNTTLVEYNDEQSAISVPDSVTIGNSSYSVTAIGAGVFSGNRFIREVILPDSLREIRSGAFINTEIAEITLPEALLTIEDNAFGGCFNLGEIQIPNTVTNIGDRAFYGCQNLETVTIGNSVLLIGSEAFGRCNLKTLTFAHATHWYLASSADAAEGSAISSTNLNNPTNAALLMRSETNRYWKNTGKYDVVFKADGNQVGIDTYSVDDKTINEPEVPTKNGYTGAWEEYTLFGDMTINAVYTPIEYTSTFVVDDVTVETKTFTVQDRGDSWFPSVPNKVGYSGKWEKSYLPLEDVTVRAVYTPIIYSVSFVADGQTVGSDTYTVEDKNITVPAVPDKTGYTGAWESYTLTNDNVTVNAVYTPITYTVAFVADGRTIGSDTYNVEDKNITIPAVPNKTGYIGAWESYTLSTGNLTINAEYTLIIYTITFVSDGRTIGSDTYTVEDKNITVPTVPDKTGYIGAWESYTLTNDNVTVNAVYTPITYTIAFVADGRTIGSDTYTVEDKNITIPAVPNKTGYIGAWESYTLSTGNLTINAEYTLIIYTVTFVADGRTIGSDTYTVEDKNITVPTVPDKIGFTGVWESYTITTGDITINAVYTLITYTVTFVADGITVGSDTYTVEDKNITVPVVPDKTGFTGEWESYILTIGDITVKALYTSVGATAGLEYTLSDNSYTVSGYEGTDTQVVIPEIYQGITVTAIGANAFNNFNDLIGLTIPRSVVSIDVSAFSSCDNMERFIAATDNSQYQSLDGILYTKENPSFVLIPKGLKGNVTILDGITAIENSAFSSRSRLTGVIIPDGVTSIGSSAFSSCSNLTNITIPNSVTSIWHQAFNECIGLKKVTISDLVAWCGIDFANETSNPLYYSSNFYLNDNIIISLEIPDGITTISDYAFIGFEGISGITIPDSVTSIGSSTFSGCGNIRSARVTTFAIPYIPKSQLHSVVITSGDAIAAKAFENCYSLSSVTLGNVNEIKNSAFRNCSNLTELKLGLQVKAIDFNSFSACSALTDITIPDSVSSIGSNAFSGCSMLTSVIIGKGVTNISSSAFNDCINISKVTCTTFAISYIPKNSLKTVVISSGDAIASSAFKNCSSLSSITIPDSVTSIGFSAFYGCSGLTSVTIGSGVTRIDDWAFVGCDGLEKVEISNIAAWCKIIFDYSNSNPLSYAHHLYINGTEVTNLIIPSSVTSISDYAFSGCSYLKSITIPNSVTAIGSQAFYDCSGLKSITIPFVGATINETNLTHFGYIFGARHYDENVNFVPTSLNTVIITGGKSIGSNAFSGCSGLTDIRIPDSVESIGVSAFNGTTWYNDQPDGIVYAGKIVYEYKGTMPANASITIKNGTLGISPSAFKNRSSLTSITIPNGIMNIGSSAFFGCSELKSVFIPDSVSFIGYGAFKGCSKLGKVEISDISAWCNIIFDGTVWNDTYNLYLNGTKITELIIPNSVTSIGNYAFASCRGLTSISIAEGVTSIGDFAFQDCSSLTSVAIPNSMTSIGACAFDSCLLLTSISIPNSVKNIGSYAFSNCLTLTSIEFSDSVSNISEGILSGCSSLTNLTLPSSVKSLGNYAFAGCSGLTSISIPEGVTSIGDNAFLDCSSLTSVTIPNSVTSIGNYAFFDCRGLTSILIPEGVTSIGDYAFRGCGGLTSITIPNSVKNIGSYAFYACNGLTSIIIPDSITYIRDYTFGDCRSLTSITIPNSVTSIHMYAFLDCSSLMSITIPNSVTIIQKGAFLNCYGLTIYTVASEKPNSWDDLWNNSNCPIVWDCNNRDIASDGYIYTVQGGIRYALKDGEATVVRQQSIIKTAAILETIEYKGTTYSVSRIENQAFFCCDSLISVSIPNTVTSIADSAFDRCVSLTNIEYKGTTAQWQAIIKGNSWDSNTGNYKITCTDGTIGK